MRDIFAVRNAEPEEEKRVHWRQTTFVMSGARCPRAAAAVLCSRIIDISRYINIQYSTFCVNLQLAVGMVRPR